MTDEIKRKINQINSGKIPEGYSKRRWILYPNDWNYVKLNTCLSENKERNKDSVYTKDDVLSVSGESGVVNQIEFMGRSYAGESVLPYHVVETGDIVYTKSPLKQNPYGIIKLNKGNPGIVSTLYAVYHCCNPITAEYLNYFFEIDEYLNSYLFPLVKKGAKNDMKVNNEDVIKGEIALPPIEEQEEIVKILKQCDKVIKLKRKRIDEEKKLKKVLMQNFFDVKSINAKEVKLHSVCDFNLLNIAENTDAETMFYYIDISCVENGNIMQPTNKIAFKDAPVRARKKFCKNDILMSTVRPNLHSFVLVDFDANEYVCSTGFAVLTPKKQYHTEIIYQQLFSKKLDRQYNNLLVGTNYPALNTSDIKSLKVVIPTDDNECRMISEVLSKQDELISSLNQELEFYLTKKKSLMQLILTGIVRVK